MSVHIAIPEPTSSDTAYNQRSLPPYLSALHSAGAVPIVVPLHERPDRVARLLLGVQGILLPGSGFDVDPAKYGAVRAPECADADPARTAVVELLLSDAFAHQKPILGICYGTQSLNVWRGGSLVQHVSTAVDHSPGRGVFDAHAADVHSASRLRPMLPIDEGGRALVNSSHHQAVDQVGQGLRVAAISPEDGVIEAVELDSPLHFVLGVQWHPERTYTHSALSRSIFAAFVQAASLWQPQHAQVTAALR